MGRVRKLSFEDLVRENKESLLKDKEALERLEEQWEKRQVIRSN